MTIIAAAIYAPVMLILSIVLKMLSIILRSFLESFVVFVRKFRTAVRKTKLGLKIFDFQPSSLLCMFVNKFFKLLGFFLCELFTAEESG